MSEHITHVAVLEDCARLALHSPDISDAIKIALRKELPFAALASTARSGDRYTIPLLRDCRDKWETRRPGGFVEEKLAFVLGWRCHNAADRHFKPIYRLVEPEHYEGAAGDGDIDMAEPSDVRIYHDIVVFREVYGGGRHGGFHPSLVDYRLESHPAAGTVDSAATEDVFGGLWQRSLLALHAFSLTEKDPDAWAEKALAAYQPYTVDLRRYAQGYYSPDPESMRRFITNNNFYDRTDPLIALARSLQRGAADPSIDMQTALRAAATQSQYAQTILKGYNYLAAASDYFLHRIEEPELRLRFDLDKPHIPVTNREG